MNKISKKTYVEALNRVAASDDGQVVLAVIRETCGYDSLVIDANFSHISNAKKYIYHLLRRDIKPQHLKEIEYGYEVNYGE